MIKTLRSKIIFHGFGSAGNSSYMAKPMRISGKHRVYIGDRVSIRKGIRLEVVTDWLGKKHNGEIHIGDDTAIEQNCHFVSANNLVIGNECLISAQVFITDCSHEYKDLNTRILLQSLIVSQTQIGDGTFIGYGACIMAGVNIGKHCVIGANSVVTHNISDYSVAAGVPAKVIRQYDLQAQEWKRIVIGD